MKIVYTFFLLLFATLSFGQVSVSSTAATPDESAMLDVISTDKGMLIPRMTQMQKTEITLPAKSLLIYQTDEVEGFYFNAGTGVAPDWQMLGGEDLILSSRTPISTIPFTITDPGSYYLTDHLSGTAGIMIATSHVTIDLNGYTITAAGGASGDGIVASAVIENVKVMNGSTIGWPDKGVDLRNADYCQVSNISSQNNGGDGIECGDHAQVNNCIVSGNAFDGIDLANYGTVSSCLTSGNVDNGIELGENCKVIYSNSNNNNGNGIEGQKYTSIADCTLTDNADSGVVVNAGSNISNTIASTNTQSGFDINTATTVLGCTARDNALHGFTSLSDSYLKGNSADGNGSAGYFTTSSDVRFDSNHATDNGTYGFDVISSFGCSLIKNTANSNTISNYNLSANNAAPMTTPATINTASNPFANINF